MTMGPWKGKEQKNALLTYFNSNSNSSGDITDSSERSISPVSAGPYKFSDTADLSRSVLEAIVPNPAYIDL